MGQVVQVNGDYTIKAKLPADSTKKANITLDVGSGPNAGDVKVTGNLVVVGESLFVNTTDLTVQDNIITLNKGELGAGVSKNYSGIEIDRGSLVKTAFVYDESTRSWEIAEGNSLTGYSFSNSSLRLKQIKTNADTDSGDLTLIGYGTGVVKVIGTTDYELQVTDDDDVPNKRYVDVAIQNNPTFQIRSPGALAGQPATLSKGDTRVVAFDFDATYEAGLFPIGPYNNSLAITESQVALLVDDNATARFYGNRATMYGMTFLLDSGTGGASTRPTILAYSSDSDLVLETHGSGKVEITTALRFKDNQGYNELVGPSPAPSESIIYGGKIGAGNTGLYVYAKNYNSSFNQRSELVSKNKALLFSMIF